MIKWIARLWRAQSEAAASTWRPFNYVPYDIEV